MKRRSLLDAGLALALVAGGATLAATAANRGDRAVKVCVGKRDTVVSAKPNGKCPGGSNIVRINQVGPVGTDGADGATGSKGDAGTGTQGERGEQGLPGAPGTNAPRPRGLGELVDEAIADFGKYDDGARGAHPYAWMAKAVAVRRGWHSPLVTDYLERVYAEQNPDGGYGLPEGWDAGGDGSVNPVDTTYAITLSDHVGPVFLEGWQNGVVPRQRVQEVIDMVETFPLATVGDPCVAYSTVPSDAGWCVGNINTSAAHFLVQAKDAGFDVDTSRVAGIVAYDRSTLLDGEWWPYVVGETRRQDWQHNATMVAGFMRLDPPTGRVTLDAMRRATVSDPFEQAALLRLAKFDCSLADPAPLAAALAKHGEDAYYVGLLAYEGAVAVEACGP